MNPTIAIYDPQAKPLDNVVTFTDSAIQYVTRKIQEHKAIGFRIGTKKAGCSGLKYVVDYVYQQKPEDQVFPIVDGLTVYIDQQSLVALQGIKVDYVREGLNGSLKFINPNEKGSCGCGESFAV